MFNAVLRVKGRHLTKNLLRLGLLIYMVLQLSALAGGENPAQLAETKTVKLNPLPLNHVSVENIAVFGPIEC